MGRAFEGIKAGLEDAIAYAQGDESRGRVVNPAIDVRGIRTKTGKTREAFAAAYALPIGTVRDWEQDKRRPDAPARALLRVIEADPAHAERILAQA